MVHVIDFSTGVLIETFALGHQDIYTDSVLMPIGSNIFCTPSKDCKKNGLEVIDVKLKRNTMIPLSYHPIIFASVGEYLIGYQRKVREINANTCEISVKGMFVIDGRTHEIILEVDGDFLIPEKIGDKVLYPNPSGHLPEDNA